MALVTDTHTKAERPEGTASQAAEKFRFVSGHDFSRAVKDREYIGL
jgi:hypothetical protein